MIVSHDGKPHDVTEYSYKGKPTIVTAMRANRVHITDVQSIDINMIEPGAGDTYMRRIDVTNPDRTKTVLVLSSSNPENLTLNYSEAD